MFRTRLKTEFETITETDERTKVGYVSFCQSHFIPWTLLCVRYDEIVVTRHMFNRSGFNVFPLDKSFQRQYNNLWTYQFILLLSWSIFSGWLYVYHHVSWIFSIQEFTLWNLVLETYKNYCRLVKFLANQKPARRSRRKNFVFGIQLNLRSLNP